MRETILTLRWLIAGMIAPELLEHVQELQAVAVEREEAREQLKLARRHIIEYLRRYPRAA